MNPPFPESRRQGTGGEVSMPIFANENQMVMHLFFFVSERFKWTVTDVHGRHGGLYHHTDYHGWPRTTISKKREEGCAGGCR